jgi:hypothetical protein
VATVTGFTAERMLEIEAASVVDGAVVGDELHLTRHDGLVINAGVVVGPQGPQGIQGVPGVDGTNGADGADAAIIISDPGGAAAPSTYATGITIHAVSSGLANGWPTNLCTVTTHRVHSSRAYQVAVAKTTGYMYVRAEGDGDTWSAWTSDYNGRLDALEAATPHTRVRASTNQNVSNLSWANVVMDTVVSSRGGMDADRSISTISTFARKAGLYICTARLRFASNATGIRYGRWTKNGVAVSSRNSQQASSGDATELEITTHQYLNVDDYVRVQAYQSSGGTLALEALSADTTSSVEITRVGA